MKTLFTGCLFLIAFSSERTLHAQVAPSIEWQKSLGGSGDDGAYSIQQTTDGGFIIAGYSGSNDADVSGNHGYQDYWIVKLDAAGNLTWQKSFGGSHDDNANSIQQTTDGGFIVAGQAWSNDGDVSGNHGGYDYWIVRLDTSGNLVWQKALGGTGWDYATSIQQTTDGGFIIAGYSESINGDISGQQGGNDYWIVKLDSSGNLVWQKTLGGSLDDLANSIQQTTDGGFIIAGQAWSIDGDVSGSHGVDYWIVKLDQDGNLLWQKCFGGSGFDGANYIQQTADSGFIIAGGSDSNNNGDVTGNHGDWDGWIVKLDSNGNLVWQKSLGGSDYDIASSVQQTTDGGFIVAGSSGSNDDDVSGNHGDWDYWIVKLDTSGNLVWQKSLGGSSYEGVSSVRQTIDGGFIVAGSSLSNDGDVSGNHGEDDYWIVKLSGDSTTGIASISNNIVSLFPNPAQNHLEFSLTTSVAETTIRIYDLQGRMISLPIAFTNTQAQLNTTSLPDGFYTLQATNNKTGASEVGKFVKQH